MKKRPLIYSELMAMSSLHLFCSLHKPVRFCSLHKLVQIWQTLIFRGALSQRSPRTHRAAENRSDKKNLFDQIPPELRRMTLDWIDQSVTPVLIDQWR